MTDSETAARLQRELDQVHRQFEQAKTFKNTNAEASLMFARKTLEAIMYSIYKEQIGPIPQNPTLDSLTKGLNKTGAFPREIGLAIGTVQMYGNFGVHSDDTHASEGIGQHTVDACMAALENIFHWYTNKYIPSLEVPSYVDSTEEPVNEPPHADSSSKGNDTGSGKPSGGGGKGILITVLALLLLGGGFCGWWFFLREETVALPALTSVSIPTSQNLWSIAAASGKFVAVGFSGTILSSSNGITWSELSTAQQGHDLYAVTANEAGTFTAVGDRGGTWHSDKGNVWIQGKSPIRSVLMDVTFLNDSFWAVGEDGVILRSSDGSNWNSTHGKSKQDLEGITYGAGKFVAVGSNDSGDSITLVSSNGTEWKESGNSLQKAILNSITHGKGTFVVAGSHFDKAGGFVGLLASSSNPASEWAVSHETEGAMILSVHFFGDRFVAFGGEGLILTSLDGKTWEKHESKTKQNLRDGVYREGTFIVVGDIGTMLHGRDQKTLD